MSIRRHCGRATVLHGSLAQQLLEFQKKTPTTFVVYTFARPPDPVEVPVFTTGGGYAK